MKTASVQQVKAQFDTYLKATAEGPVIVTRNGKPTAALIGIDQDTDLDGLVPGPKRKLRDILQAADQRISAGEGIPADEFWRQLDRQYEKRREPRRKKAVR